ncbi:MAG: hypothetical protein M1346_01090 [Gammaproteobacteria bacterium]|nr:hypothetical protein [Gammaproteobacteria bacterium]
MISKDTYSVIMNVINSASNAKLMVIKDELRELTRHPIAVDKEFAKDVRKLLKKIDEEIETRYDLYLIEKHRSQKTPASVSAVVPLRNHRDSAV